MLREWLRALPAAAEAIAQWLDRMPEPVDTAQQIQRNEEMRHLWRDVSAPWQRAATERLLRHDSGTHTATVSADELTLLEEEDMELQILAGRLAQVMAAPAQYEFNDLRLRLQHLEGWTELPPNDNVQAAHMAQAVLRGWTQAGLTREDWNYCKAQVEPLLAQAYTEACHHTNAWLLKQGVLPHIDLRALVRRSPNGAPLAERPKAAGAGSAGGGNGGPGKGKGGKGGGPGEAALQGAAAKWQDMTQRLRKLLGNHVPAAARWLDQVGSGAPGDAGGASTPGGTSTGPATGAGPRPRSEATTLLVQMPTHPVPSALQAAGGGPVSAGALQAGVAELRQQTRALKRTATSDQDKAVIEVVALIFDSILAEERLPPSIRVWFARLQMPVLRVALKDADFLGSTGHPARLLMDRMGACVMGFDAAVSLEPMEAEMRRVVQVVEQYPETGRKVFEIVHKEFEAFLAKHLLARGEVKKVANLAEQVELKETLTVKFTIELRKLLGQAPVAEPVRDFLFHVWTEVLAVATVRHGPQHPQSASLRAVAGELLWMASAKPTRAERAKVIARLPSVMAQLRAGMELLSLGPEAQEQRIKLVSDALVEAFMARSDPLPEQWLREMTARLAALDDYLADTEVEHMKLDQYSIEMLTGVDASDLVVVPDTPQPVSAALREWARGLEQGAWFELNHNGFGALVQLSWRSPRKQLYLFASADRRSFLLQQGRVGQYLDAGLLKPCEAETLTLRATRDALNKLDANPERLLA